MNQTLQVIVSSTTSFENIINNENVTQRLIQQVTTQTTKLDIPDYNIIT